MGCVISIPMKRPNPADDDAVPWPEVYDGIFESLDSRLWQFLLLGQGKLNDRNVDVERLSFLVVTERDAGHSRTRIGYSTCSAQPDEWASLISSTTTRETVRMI